MQILSCSNLFLRLITTIYLTLLLADYLANLGNISVNTRPTNLTGHPAISLKAGFHHVNGLPIGTMLISKHFDEVTLFKVASHFERLNSSA